MSDAPELLSTTDAAKELGVAPSTLRAWATRYYDLVKSSFVTENGSYRWDVEELIRVCNAHAASARES